MALDLGILAGAVGEVVAEVTATAIAEFGRVRLARRAQRMVGDAAAQILLRHDYGDWTASLSEGQVHALAEWARSPQFAHLVLQTAIGVISGAKTHHSVVRDQVREGIRLSGAFSPENLYEATDFAVALIDRAVASIPLDTKFAEGRALAVAAGVAAAGVRNTSLLSRITSLEEIFAFMRSLRSAIATQHNLMRVSHTGRTMTAAHDRLYVMPNVRLSSETGWLSNEMDMDGSVSRIPPVVLGSLTDGFGERLTLEEVVGGLRRAVVLGDPGAGKSTFAGKLVHDIAANNVAAFRDSVPLLLVVRDHVGSLRSDHETIVHYLEAVCRRPYHLPPPPDAIEYMLLNGYAVVVIDGLDELGDSHHRESFTRMVDNFARRYPLVRIVVTSRLIGYYDAPLDGSLFPTAEIAPFTVSQIRRYVESYFQLDQRFDPHDIPSKVDAFMDESRAAPDVRENPLMLSLLCTLYTSANYIPRNRPELYEKCAQLLFETWDSSRGIHVPHRFAANIKPAVEVMAWKLLTDPAGRQAIPRSELVADLAAMLRRKRFEDHDEARQAAEDFIKFCAGRAWVLAEVGSDLLQPKYGFVHRTFLEYFAACQLVRFQPTPEAVWQMLLQRVLGSAWEVVAQLAVQILERAHQDGADDLITLALADAASFERDGIRANAVAILTFCVRCLDSVVPSNSVLQAMIEQIARMANTMPLSERKVLPTSGTRVALADVPLLELLNSNATDNVDRVSRVLARTLTELARTSPPDLPAGLLCWTIVADVNAWRPKTAVRLHTTSALKKALAERSVELEVLPEKMAAPQRFAPAMAGLFLETVVLDQPHPAPALRHLTRLQTDPHAVSDALTRLYPAVLEAFVWPLESVPARPVFVQQQYVGSFISVTTERTHMLTDHLMTLSTTAQSTALLLAIAGAVLGPYHIRLTDPSIVLVAAAKIDNAKALARKHLDTFDLTPEALDKLSSWIDYLYRS